MHINNVDDEYRKQHKFYCLQCGKEMIANLKDDYRCKHFSHKNKSNCSYETYLHSLSKKLIKQVYDNSPEFYLKYFDFEICSYSDCQYRTYECKHSDILRSVNLKDWYDICEVEKEINGYVADVLLTSSKPNIPPLLIEIYVHHECSPEKKNSGLRIVETAITSEDDIYKICQDMCIVESSMSRLYNFKRGKSVPLTRDIIRFVHKPNEGSSMTTVKCVNALTEVDKESDVEINITYSDEEAQYKYSEEEIVQYINLRYGMESKVTMSEEDGNVVLINTNRIKFTLVKGAFPIDYRVVIYGPHKFINSEVIADQVEYYLANKRKEVNVVLVAAFSDFSAGVLGAAERINLPLEIKTVEWERYGKSAGYRNIYDMLAEANAAIVFDNAGDKMCKFFIEQTQKKGIPLGIVHLEQIDGVCPECGYSLILRHGKYGPFYGCINYPDCGYKRPAKLQR